jgi:hypothetical protein
MNEHYDFCCLLRLFGLVLCFSVDMAPPAEAISATEG